VSAGPRPSTPPRRLAGVASAAGLAPSAVAAIGDPASLVEVRGVTHDSRGVVAGDLYAALPGFRTHGAEFVADAVAAGAVAVLTDPSGADRASVPGVPVVVVDDPRRALGAVASYVYGDPSHELVVVGITGTNGKTTISYLVDAGFRAAGHVTGVIGTVGTRIGDDVVPTSRTTPEATDVHALLAVMRERGVTAVTMEVSSHAMRLGRVDGVRFTVVGFTNLTEDHLDFHDDMTDYFDAKAQLFSTARADRGVVCLDDAWGVQLLERATRAGLPCTTYAVTRDDATWTAHDVTSVPGGSVLRAHGPAAVGVPVEVHLPGAFNVANALGAVALLAAAGVDPHGAAHGIAQCPGVPGRMERVTDPDLGRGLFAYVDYAHTPDAVERALAAAREVATARAGTRGRVLVVLGAGGDRDPHKRFAMGEAAVRGADVVIVTDDNPRSEDPAAIRREILRGARTITGKRRLEVADRRKAIAFGVALAGVRDVLLILGKGHEQGQEVAGTVTPFDDRVVLAELLASAEVQPADAPEDQP
jgi:UDP-N-acetylmuramoyl-L-alanyl-D-glutamate--2,6-diaminopimelate ligase